MPILLVKSVLSIYKELFINYLAHFGEHTHNLHVFVGPLCGETQGTCKMYSLFLGLLHSTLFLCKTVATRIVAATKSNTTEQLEQLVTEREDNLNEAVKAHETTSAVKGNKKRRKVKQHQLPPQPTSILHQIKL